MPPAAAAAPSPCPPPAGCPYAADAAALRRIDVTLHGDGTVDGAKGLVVHVQYLVDREREREQTRALMWRWAGGLVAGVAAVATLTMLPRVLRWLAAIVERTPPPTP